jgi:hypothetical protein
MYLDRLLVGDTIKLDFGLPTHTILILGEVLLSREGGTRYSVQNIFPFSFLRCFSFFIASKEDTSILHHPSLPGTPFFSHDIVPRHSLCIVREGSRSRTKPLPLGVEN